jgi:hypothetical protein
MIPCSIKLVRQNIGDGYDDREDWFTIEKSHLQGEKVYVADGTGKTLYNPNAPTGTSCIQGSTSEILAISKAILGWSREKVSFKRVAIFVLDEDNVFLWSPKSGHISAVLSLKDARAFANNVLEELNLDQVQL